MDTALRDRAADVFGWDLRDAQATVIDAVLRGRDALALMPTGSGKSAIYQVAGLALDGLVVVVSPLVSLQQDQVVGLRSHPDAPPAVAINATVSASDVADAWDAIAAGDVRYVFLAPEQLAKDEVVERLADAGVALLTVDEAHCVSSWGHDFRPAYLALGEAAERLGRPPVLALTATGSAPVRDDVVARLGMRDPVVLAAGFDRPGIRIEVERYADADEKRAAVVEQAAAATGTGIVYVATRRETDEYAEALRGRGKDARSYHAGMRARDREAVLHAFHDGEVDVVVATSAFGMGIDKENVRFVIHADVPESIDAYFQELGRAGRDGDEAHGTLHYRAEDLALRRYFATKNPDAAELRTLMRAMSTRARTKSALAKDAGLSPRRVTGLLTLLVDTGSARASKSGVSLRRNLDERAAVKAALERVEERERIERSRIETMREYAETRRCRRQVLLGYFGQELDEPCGNCDTCAAGAVDAARAAASPSDSGFEIDEKVSHREWGAGTVVSIDDDRMRVFFDSEGYKVLSLEIVEREHLLKAG